ncbi:hypothetical protein [Streptomyces sp. NBC_00847]|uniref:hypothetical protein n=1 Tax=unclassified Streptomyces TaxID=2593676 RepID=UPI0022569EAF|nr:hypothetical protein [Streptomyces sp. NBC_00847]MCX4881394.1 hypothetical protein [Streptomyces sp. NBC_00847]
MAESLLRAKNAMVFFLADDDERGTTTWDLLDRCIRTSRAGTDDELAACFISLLQDLRDTTKDTGPYTTAMADWISHSRVETQADFTRMTPKQRQVMRHHTVFVRPHVACRIIQRDLATLPPSCESALQDSLILEQTVDLVSLCNDIGSIERERPRPGHRQELNLIWQEAVTKHVGVDELIDLAIDRYNVKGSAFATTVNQLMSQATTAGTPWLAEYAALLKREVNGNLEAHRYLVQQRYPGATHRLQALHTIP